MWEKKKCSALSLTGRLNLLFALVAVVVLCTVSPVASINNILSTTTFYVERNKLDVAAHMKALEEQYGPVMASMTLQGKRWRLGTQFSKLSEPIVSKDLSKAKAVPYEGSTAEGEKTKEVEKSYKEHMEWRQEQGSPGSSGGSDSKATEAAQLSHHVSTPSGDYIETDLESDYRHDGNIENSKYPSDLDDVDFNTPHMVNSAPGARSIFQYNSQEELIDTTSHEGCVPVTLVGDSTVVIKFDAIEGNVINTIVQIMNARYEAGVTYSNCLGMYISATLRSKWAGSQHLSGLAEELYSVATEQQMPYQMEKNMLSMTSNLNKDTDGDAEDVDDDEGNAVDSSFWDILVTLFDTSPLCKMYQGVSMRLSKAPRSEPYYVVLHSSIMSEYRRYPHDTEYDHKFQCSSEVFFGQTSAKRQFVMQIVFSLVIPLLLVLVPIPFLLRRVEIIYDVMSDVDIGEWIWFPPYAFRRAIVVGCTSIYTRCTTQRLERRERERQQQLEERQRELSQQMNRAAEEAASRRTAQVTTDNAEAMFSPSESSSSHSSSRSSSHSRHGSATRRGVYTREEQDAAAAEEADAQASVSVRVTGVTVSPPHDTDPAVVAVETLHPPAPQLTNLQLSGQRGGSGSSISRRQSKKYGGDNNRKTRKAHDVLFTTTSNEEEARGAEESEEKCCRICRDGEDLEPLVAPCACTGSVRWIHRTCLDHWRVESTKRNLQNVNNCEICKQPFTVSIRRSALLWEGSQRIISIFLFIFTLVITMACILVFSYAGVGELSCLAMQHEVAYSSMYTLEGIILALFVYCMVVLLILFANLVVYSWFRSRREVIDYIREERTEPPFWTRRNVLEIIAVFVVLAMQVVSLGYLAKIFLYATSNIAWNWEIAPMLGAMLYSVIIPVALNAAYAVSKCLQRSLRSTGEAAVDVVIEDATAATDTAAAAPTSGAEEQNNSSDGNADENSASPAAIRSHVAPRSLPEQPADQSHLPPEMRVIRAVEYCPPRRPQRRV